MRFVDTLTFIGAPDTGALGGEGTTIGGDGDGAGAGWGG